MDLTLEWLFLFFSVAGKWFLRGTRALCVGPLCVQSRSQECLHHGPQLRRAVFRWAGECFSFPLILPTSHWHKDTLRHTIHFCQHNHSQTCTCWKMHIPSHTVYRLPFKFALLYPYMHINILVCNILHILKLRLSYTQTCRAVPALVTSGRRAEKWYCVKHGGTIKNK